MAINFKYYADYERLASLTGTEVRCEICNLNKICFDSGFCGEDEVEHVCADCLYSKKLYGRDIFTNIGNDAALLSQIKSTYPDLTDKQQEDLASERSNELTQATPDLLTWQDMIWPCLDGDYAKFIGFGSKDFLDLLAKDGNGKELYKQCLHPDLIMYFDEDQWADIPDKEIKTIDETNYNMLVYIFKSLTTDKIIIWWDCN